MDNFGKFESGNKVYFNELEKYFKTHPEFKKKKTTFKEHILTQIKVNSSSLIH